jgi:hypothetical protein
MPAFATLNGTAVVRGAVSLPWWGAWTARLTLDAETAPSGPVVLTTNEGAVTFAGTVVRGAAVYGRVEVLVRAGGPGLDQQLPPRVYRSIPARLVVEALLGECGEALAPDSDAQLLDQQLPHWTRLAGPASRGLDRLMEALGARRRFNRAGQVLVTASASTTPSTTTGQRLDDAPAEDYRVYALDRLDLEPGQVFDGRTVDAVEHEISPDRIRSQVWFR